MDREFGRGRATVVWDRAEGYRWSHDGTRLAFVADGQIRVRWMDNGEETTLTQLVESPSSLRWSPDDRYLAFNMLKPYPAPSLASPPEPPEGADWAAPPILEDRFKNRQDGVGYLDFGYSHIYVVSGGGRKRQGRLPEGTSSIRVPRLGHPMASIWSSPPIAVPTGFEITATLIFISRRSRAARSGALQPGTALSVLRRYLLMVGCWRS